MNMEKIISRVELSKEKKDSIYKEYFKNVERLANDYKRRLTNSKEEIISVIEQKRNHKSSSFESVESTEMEAMRDMLALQDVNDFYDILAEYRAAAELAGIEPYDFEYDEEEFDELLYDISDTTGIINERNLKTCYSAIINEALEAVMKGLGYTLIKKEKTGKRNDIVTYTYAFEENVNLVVMEASGKLTLEPVAKAAVSGGIGVTDSISEKCKEHFAKLYDTLKDRLRECGVDTTP